MGRLTKRHGKYAIQIGGETRRNDVGWLKLAEYEDLVEQGRLIEKQPTAYDPDEVVQQLEYERNEDVTTITYEHDIFIDGYREGLSKAIEIVKGGAE